jgi:hypothetical protein
LKFLILEKDSIEKRGKIEETKQKKEKRTRIRKHTPERTRKPKNATPLLVTSIEGRGGTPRQLCNTMVVIIILRPHLN